MDERPASETTAWVVRACAGDAAAFARLVRHYQPVLLALTFLRTRNLCDAEDRVQEILLRVWRKLPGLRNPDLFRPWMRAIAANACGRWGLYRPIQTASLDTEPACLTLERGAARPLDALMSAEKQRELHRVLLQIPAANRLALLMHEWGGYSHAQIADFTEVRATTVEGRIYRAKQQLRSLLRDGGAALCDSRPASPMPDYLEENAVAKTTDK
ncbi:MAG TPA: RNA polymerase sigma factor [Chthonomonadaceae bacterium]|nr:RNA polymerase sigma factor [Chthonomonadaceae bacterium]